MKQAVISTAVAAKANKKDTFIALVSIFVSKLIRIIQVTYLFSKIETLDNGCETFNYSKCRKFALVKIRL